MKKTSFTNAINSSIQNRLISNFGALVVIIIILFELSFVIFISNYYYGGVEQILKDRVSISAEFLNKYSSYYTPAEKAKIFFDTSKTTYEDKFLVQVIGKDRTVLLDSNGFSENVEINTADVNSAFENKTEIYRYNSPTTGERLISASRPLVTYNNIDGVIRFVTSLDMVEKRIQTFIIGSVLLAIILIGIFLFIAGLISKTITNPLKELNLTAREFAKGNMDLKAKKTYNDEVGELADTLNLMADEIKKAEKLKVEFISSISHELRTPLTSIKGWSETLQMTEAYQTDSDIAIGLNIISNEADRLKVMVEELLDFSRFQSGDMKVNKKEVNVKDVMFQVYRQFSNKRSVVTLKCDFKGEDTIIYADPNRLKQVYINLITNAIKFTPAEGTIEMVAIGYQDKIVTQVIDNGSGIKEKDLPKVKEKFFKGNNTAPGNGLGLSIVDEIVRIHDGVMDIQSKENEGTTITITFPSINKKENQEQSE